MRFNFHDIINLVIKLFKELKRMILIRRLNRFTLLVKDKESCFKAYLPNSGSLEELLIPGKEVLVSPNLGGSLPFRTVGAFDLEGEPVMIDSMKVNDILPLIINRIPWLKDHRIVKREVAHGNSRFDFLLEGEGGERLILEVKGCTLFGFDIAAFPDAPTERGTKHVKALASLEPSLIKGGILFLIQRPVSYFMPNFHRDPEFARSLFEARERIGIGAVSLRWNEDLSLDEESIREVKIPWEKIEPFLEDKGAYIVLLSNPRETSITLPSGRSFSLKEGFYAYVGSGLRGLSSRIRRHERGRGNPFWHIDYIKPYMNIIRSIPIRSPKRIECEIAKELEGIADSSIVGFGCSDCRCKSHLFYFKEEPTSKESFIRTLMRFQFGIIKEYLL